MCLSCDTKRALKFQNTLYHYYKTLVLKTGKRLFIQVGVNFDIGLCWFMGNANALLMSEE